jgi:hypothetical protein
MKPKVKAVQYSYWKEDCASNQESPHGMRKAGEDVRKPCDKASDANK